MQLRLASPQLDFWVDVRLFSFGGKWLAVAMIADEAELGLGLGATEAIAGALSSLGDHAVNAFLATQLTV
jgi:hypothetical protein